MSTEFLHLAVILEKAAIQLRQIGAQNQRLLTLLEHAGYKSQDLKQLGLSIRARRVCVFMGVESLEEFTTKTRDDLREQRNCGPLTIQEISDKMAEFGWKFKAD
jgi:DNA-directed RNA polymerase alpha subunit